MVDLSTPHLWLILFVAALSAGCDGDSRPRAAVENKANIAAKSRTAQRPVSSTTSLPIDELSAAANERHVPADKLRGPSRATHDFYTVDHYDIARNADEDLAMTIKRAQAEKKHILLQVGGDWCGWCHLMSNYIETNDEVRKRIEQNYLIMKVTYDGDQKNEEFLARYPNIPGYPHLFVLDSDGNLLHSQGTAELEEGRGYNDKVYLDFLDKWKPGS